MTSSAFKLLAISAVLLSGFGVSAAQQLDEASIAAQAAASTSFVKKRYSISGEWSVAEHDGQTQIRFSDGFKTKGGPDLKVFLSKHPIETLDSKTAVDHALNIGVLKSKSGAQIYTLPEDVDLADYKSLIIHCEAFSVLWGGFDLPEPAHSTSLTAKP